MHSNGGLKDCLRAATHAATSTNTELWERTRQGKRVVPLDNPDRFADARAADEELLGQEEKIDRVLAKFKPEERKVADCYAAAGLTLAQAAFKAGQPAFMGERVRRKLKRLAAEDHRCRR
ncbi:hypothetical protein AB0E67_35060 [Streptomyces sp. NPDC032161]|uniref:hypothetical protein n=1 Tax=unclassified Streptomyces TaxID=2593676 RepID=UPI0033C30178